MKKTMLVKLLILTCLCLAKAQTRIDTFVIQNHKDTFTFQTPFEVILTTIVDKQDSRYAKDSYDRFKIRRTEAVVSRLNSLNKDIDTDIFKKMLFFKSIFYEKNLLSFDEYINIQEWVFKDCNDAIVAVEKLEAARHKPMESFTQSMNWIWVRSDNIVYYIDTTSDYEDSNVIEILHSIQDHCKVNTIGFFESLFQSGK